MSSEHSNELSRIAQPDENWCLSGKLPHFTTEHHLQAITYRLADSIPAKVKPKIEVTLDDLPDTEKAQARRIAYEDWLDAGYGDCILRDPEIAKLVIDAWKFYDNKRYHLIAWVVMPNHVHLMIKPLRGNSLSKIIQAWKGYTGNKISEWRRAEALRAVPTGKSPIPEKAKQWSNHIWMPDYWDRYIRNAAHYEVSVDYIHNNPVKAGLVTEASQWPWSSASLEQRPLYSQLFGGEGAD